MYGRRSHLAQNEQRRHRPDYWLALLSVILLAFGLIVVYSISPGLAAQNNVSENYYVTKQLVAIGLGFAAFLAVINIPLNFWSKAEKPLIIFTIGSALAVRIFGEQVNGAYRWIHIGGLSFQPAELIKFVLILWLAGFLAKRISSGELNNQHQTLKPIVGALAAVVLVVGGLQSDLGSTGVIAAVMAVMVFVAGLPMKKIAMIGGIMLAAVFLLISSSAYRRDRVATYFNPSRDCVNSGYQACQALITVGSGGMFGLGLGRSVQAYGYLPEAANDSIFAIYAEKFGFGGVIVLLSLFAILFTRIKRIIERTPDTYSRLVVTGVLAWLSTQTIINIGAMLGLLPLKGITLPFISYGGTSILFVMAAIGLIFQISRYTTYNVIQENAEGRRAYENSPNGRRNGRPHYAYSSRRT